MKAIKAGDIFGDRKITKIIKRFHILYSGWEMDDIGYVVEHERVDKKNANEKTKVSYVISSHGSFGIVDDDVFIKEKLEEYTKALAETRHAMELKNLANGVYSF